MSQFKKQSPRRNFYIDPSKLSSKLRAIIQKPQPVATTDVELVQPLFSRLVCNAEAKNIMNQVLETDYFKGIKEGNLSPNDYGCLYVEDAYYCFKGADDYFSAAASSSQYAELSEFLILKGESYKEYNTYYNCPWHIREAYSVLPGQAIQDYADYEAYVAGSLDSIYTLVVMLPCEYLWWWLASQLNDDVSSDNVYRCWVDSNYAAEPSGANQMGVVINNFYDAGLIDYDTALDIYLTALKHELQVFTNATIDQCSNE